MRNLAVALASLSFIGVIILFVMHFSGNKRGSAPVVAGAASSVPLTGKLAYVNLDSLEVHYDYLKQRSDELKQEQDKMDAELGNSYQQMQNDAAEVQKKAQAQTLTQTEYEAAEKRLMQMQQSLETRRQSLSEKLLKKQDDLKNEVKVKLDAFLEQYNKDKHFDFVFSYRATGGSALMYVNKQLDITKDVIEGMNAASKDEAAKK